jgi:HSP20 family protein
LNNSFREVQNYLRDSLSKFGNLSIPTMPEISDYIVPIRMKEEEDSYTVQVMVPGFNKDELKVTIEDNVLIVSGERSKDESYKDNSEFFSEKCERKIALYDDIDYQNVKVDLKNGILNIHLPKEESKSKKAITFTIDD